MNPVEPQALGALAPGQSTWSPSHPAGAVPGVSDLAPTAVGTSPDIEVTQIRDGYPKTYRGRRSSVARTVIVGRRWAVRVDGVLVGTVEYQLITREQRTPRATYVNARWTSPGWLATAQGRSRPREETSKVRAIDWLVRETAGA